MKLPGHKKRKHIAADISSKPGRARAERELILGDHGFLREGIEAFLETKQIYINTTG